MRTIFVLISLILFTSCNTKSNSPKGIEQNNLSDTTAINNEEESDEEWYVNSGTAKPEMSDEEWEKLSEELPT